MDVRYFFLLLNFFVEFILLNFIEGKLLELEL